MTDGSRSTNRLIQRGLEIARRAFRAMQPAEQTLVDLKKEFNEDAAANRTEDGADGGSVSN